MCLIRAKLLSRNFANFNCPSFFRSYWKFRRRSFVWRAFLTLFCHFALIIQLILCHLDVSAIIADRFGTEGSEIRGRRGGERERVYVCTRCAFAAGDRVNIRDGEREWKGRVSPQVSCAAAVIPSGIYPTFVFHRAIAHCRVIAGSSKAIFFRGPYPVRSGLLIHAGRSAWKTPVVEEKTTKGSRGRIHGGSLVSTSNFSIPRIDNHATEKQERDCRPASRVIKMQFSIFPVCFRCVARQGRG